MTSSHPTSRYAEDRGQYVAAILGVVLDTVTLHLSHGDEAAIDRLRPEVVRSFATTNAGKGVQSFVERRPARFVGY